MYDAEDVDALFRAVGFRRTLSRLADRIPDPAFWRALNPDLTITEQPAAGLTPYDVPWLDGAAVRARLATEGHFVTPPIAGAEDVARLAGAIGRVVDAGFPPGFALVYDEFYQLYARLEALFAAVLGPRSLFLPKDFWAFHVPPGDAARTRWTAFNPHRDWIGSDPAVLAGESPLVLTAWVALTDVTPLDSCLYVVPADCDAEYRTATSAAVDEANVRWQDIRALPAAAGSVVLLSSHIAHWGSRSSALAGGPRVSVTACRQSRAAAPFQKWTVDLDGPVPFADRLTWIYDAISQITGKSEARAVEALLKRDA